MLIFADFSRIARITDKCLMLSNRRKYINHIFHAITKQQSNKSRSLPIFTANETITNVTQYELSQEKTDLLKAGLYFSIQPEEIRKSEIFTTFEKIHLSFINNLKSEGNKTQIKAHLSYLANSYFYKYKPSPRILTSTLRFTEP